MLVNSSIRDLDSKGMSLSAKAGAARHAVSRFRRAVRVKITIEDRERGNLAAEFKRNFMHVNKHLANDIYPLRLEELVEQAAGHPYYVTLD